MTLLKIQVTCFRQSIVAMPPPHRLAHHGNRDHEQPMKPSCLGHAMDSSGNIGQSSPQCQLERPMAEATNAATSLPEIAALHDVFLALVSLTAII